MRVDEPWQHTGSREIDPPGACGRVVRVVEHRGDLVAGHDKGACERALGVERADAPT